jgi:subtilisin family serine protease
MRSRFALLVGALVVALFALPAGGALSAAATDTYIVQMLESPAVAYGGGVSGLAATKPGKGKKLDPSSSAVTKYSAHLESKHDQALAKVGGGTKVYDYSISYNGFTANLTEAQAQKLENVAGVVAVTKDTLRTVDTSSTPDFLGLTATGGLWDQLGGATGGGKKGAAGPGENVVIGVIDSGIWPESQSFSDRKNGKLVYQNIPHRNFPCQEGEGFTEEDCNKKLIGAQFFNAAWGGSAALEAERPWEFQSPRDYNGHGTHTASTSGGNNGVPATGAAAAFGKVSGMAPRARIAAYKALWSTQDGATASGFNSDLVAAIDTAVADGVDVINYSISGTTSNFLDPAEVSFLFAADAGVFVSASAGNSGPTTGTVAHPSPWITTVAAGTHNRDGVGSVTLGNGVTHNGASVANAVGPAPLINSEDVGLAGADPTALALCFTAGNNGGTPVLDPAKVAGKIVVCDRGVNARVDKSQAVLDANGAGMIMTNTSPNSINADFHFVPTVHVHGCVDTDPGPGVVSDCTQRTELKAYADTAGATATINQAEIVFNAPAPLTASFSSRGPLTAGAGDLLKPDVIAPGQDVLAAMAPTAANAGRDFDMASGTSMSAPHVAGLAALLKHAHPTWSPMAIKSALMTSASDVIDGPNTNQLVIFRQGAGHVRPNSAVNPGLVFDSSFNDWLAFLCGTTTGVNPATCTSLKNAGFSHDPSDFNSASIAIGALAGNQTVTRKVTNVSGAPETFTASVTGMSGITVNVGTIGTVNPGQTKSFTVEFIRTSAAFNAYQGGQLTLASASGKYSVRIPLVIRPVALAAPASVSGTGGPINYDVTFGYTGAFSATARGLVPATTTPGTVADDPADGNCQTLGAAETADKQHEVISVPAGTTHLRASLFDADVAPGADIDICLFDPSGTFVQQSTSGTSAEQVNAVNPVAGNWTLVVHGWGVPGTSPYVLNTWLVPDTAAGNMAVSAPASATLGQTATIGLTFSSLAPATRYLGSVAYSGTAGLPNPTLVNVTTP